MLAKALAGECDITFISESASDIVSSSQHGSKVIKELFERARKYAPAILFIDEIDAIGKTRTGNNSYSETTLNTLLTQMDGFKVDMRRPVLIIGATNFSINERDGYKSLDQALVRRFDRTLLIDLPTKNERYELLQLLFKKIIHHHISDMMIKNIAERSIGLSQAVLTNIVNTALRKSQQLCCDLSDSLLEEAFETIVYGEEKDWGEERLMRTAWHEAGHAYMYYKSGYVPSYLTIVARG